VNPYLIDLLGYSFEEFIGKELWEIGISKDIIANKEKFQELLEKQYIHYEDLPLKTADGREIWVEFVSNVYEVDHRQVIQCNIRNITERKQAEKEKQQLEEKAQINSRLTAVGEMAAGIAHEINNPLTGVIGFSQLLLEKQNVPDDIKDEVRIIADGSKRVADIVKRLLTFARQTKPIRTLTNLNELIDNTLKLREYVLKTANITVVTRFDPELPWSVIDPGQVQQVFLNLIVNAEQEMKKAHGKGTLTITTEKNENNIRISFQDDGPGITKENMGHLFEPFFTTKDVGEGTGLGLSLSRSIVLEHGGIMSVKSEFGQGATFIIELPIVESPPAEITTSNQIKAQPLLEKSGRILVVDDEPGVRALLEKVLILIGYKVDTITDAKIAMDKLDAGAKYDAILLDIRMPGMNGIELYAHILEKIPELKSKIIIVTGDVMGADIKDFLAKNNLPSLAKPFDIKLLKETINKIMGSGQS
jgi:PAS domain S-box-containing protein